MSLKTEALFCSTWWAFISTAIGTIRLIRWIFWFNLIFSVKVVFWRFAMAPNWRRCCEALSAVLKREPRHSRTEPQRSGRGLQGTSRSWAETAGQRSQPWKASLAHAHDAQKRRESIHVRNLSRLQRNSRFRFWFCWASVCANSQQKEAHRNQSCLFI